MAEGFLPSAKNYVKNLSIHLRLFLRRKESLREVWQRVARDAKRTAEPVVDIDLSTPRARAVQLVKSGRTKYHARDYETAEKCFRSALLEDPRFTLALTFLGNALYKQGHHDDATAAWQRAYTLEPTSDAGLKAYQKLKHLGLAGSNGVAQLEEAAR
jgi:tetratricopeptide (TPR) repeat protein